MFNAKVVPIQINIIFVLLTVYSLEGFSMSLFTKPEEVVVLSSPMEGRITFENTPVAGAKIERIIKWKDDVGEIDIATTDKNGNFNLPIVKVNVKLSKFTEYALSVNISVMHKNQKHLIWTLGNRSKKLYGELGGIPVNFRCELTDEEIPLRLENSFLLTKCKWDEIKPYTGE